MEKKRLLITGAGGFLGSNLARELGEQGFAVTAAIHETPPPPLDCPIERLDLADLATIRQYLLWTRFDAIVHCAAVSTQKACEENRKRAFLINVQATRELAEAAWLHRSRFIYISTDLVFDGSKGRYTEEDAVHPLSYYAETKCLAEQDVRLAHPEHLILRAALMYGNHGGRPGGFLGWTVEAMRRGEPLHLYLNQFRAMLHAPDIGTVIRLLLEKNLRGETYHVAGPERLSRLEMGRRIAEAYRMPDAPIVPSRIARIPSLGELDDIALDTTKVRTATGFVFTPVAEGLTKTYLRWSARRT